MRIIMAGVVGGIVMFIWASIAHMATPLATIGLKPLPNESAVVDALHKNLGDHAGLYIFPFMKGSPSDEKAMDAQQAALKVQPFGIMSYMGPGTDTLSMQRLGTEAALEIVESILAAAILAGFAGFGRRLGIAVVIGVLAAVSTNLSYWNWYGFDLDYTLANAFTELMKYVFAGAVIAAILGWPRRRA